MALTKCPHCEDRHACHRVDGEHPGHLLYERLQKDWMNGIIGFPGSNGEPFPWDQLSEREQNEWARIANL